MILGNSLITPELLRPFHPENVGPASYDVTLADSFMYLGQPEFKAEGQAVFLEPNRLLLACTVEKFTLPNDIVGYVEGRSSWGRLGLFVQNAGFVDPGFDGQITLELFNASSAPIRLVPGMRIAQLVFMRCEGCTVGYRNRKESKYNGQSGATASRLCKEF